MAIARGWLPWPAFPMLSLMIGFAFSGLLFVGHEVMHGGMVRGRRLRLLVGGLCFAPLVVSAHLWAAWHNRAHHANANRLDVDPDMYPSLARYRSHRAARFTIDHFALGGRRWRGLLSVFFGFTGQSVQILWTARACLHLSARAHRRVIVETLAAAAWWIVLASVIGAVAFTFAFVLPLLVANAIVMSFILTNHSLSPATDVNDPLLGALSVTTPRWVEWLTLHFGYHVEHHLFPTVSARHARAIRAEILASWPERYQSMPLSAALERIFETGRVYRDATTLVDPSTAGEWSTLSPGDHPHRETWNTDSP
jgi:fatty acid desaturase